MQWTTTGLSMWLPDEQLDGLISSGKLPAEQGDYAVYATILEDRKFRGPSNVPLIRQRTFTMDGLGFWAERGRPEPVRRLIGEVPRLLAETVDDFIRKNREPVDLKPVSMGFPYLLLPESERQRFFRGTTGIESGYRKLREDFPRTHGLISLSRVGFDRDRRQSIVAFGHQFGGRCGRGEYVFLELRDGCWIVVRSTMAWIS
jgi:hypothetical protein